MNVVGILRRWHEVDSIQFWKYFGLAVLLFVAGLWFSYFAFVALRYPLALDVNENFVLDQVQRFIAHPRLATLYPSVFEEPYVANPYPPLFPLLQAGVVRALGIEAQNAVGRAISLVSLVLAAVCLALVVRRYVGTWTTGVVAALSFVFSGHILTWAMLNRIDFLGVAFTAFGVLAVVRWPRAGHWLAALCFTLAFYTKVSFIAAPIATVVYLWLAGRRQQAVFCATTVAALIVAGGVGLSALTQGQFWFHVITINANQYFYLRDLDLVFNFFSTWPVVFLQVPVFAYLYLLLRRRVQLERGSLEQYFVVYTCVALLTLPSYARAGSGVNYFFEFQWAFTALAIISFTRLLAGPWRDIFGPVIRNRLTLGIFLILNLIVLKNVFTVSLQRVVKLPYSRLASDIAGIGQLVKLHGGDYFEEVMAYRPFVNGQWYLADARMFVQLARHGVWDQRPFVQKIERCEFKAVVLTGYSLNDRRYSWTDGDAGLTDEMILALKQHYRLDNVFGERFVYYPKLEVCGSS